VEGRAWGRRLWHGTDYGRSEYTLLFIVGASPAIIKYKKGL